MKSMKSVISFILCAAMLLCVVSATAAGGTIYSNEFNLRNRIKLKTPEPTPEATEVPQEVSQAEPEATDDLTQTPAETLPAETPVEEPQSTAMPVEEPQGTETPVEEPQVTDMPATDTPVDALPSETPTAEPEPTEEPLAPTTEALPDVATDEPATPEGEELLAETIEPEKTVYIPSIELEMVSEWKEIYWYGDLIELRAVVSNGDPNVDYASYITWQRSLDGTNWETVDGIGYAYRFVMSENTTGYSWRAALELPDTDDTAITE